MLINIVLFFVVFVSLENPMFSVQISCYSVTRNNVNIREIRNMKQRFPAFQSTILQTFFELTKFF